MACLHPLADSLEFLDISGTAVTERGFGYMRLFSNLRFLNISRLKVSNHLIKSLYLGKKWVISLPSPFYNINLEIKPGLKKNTRLLLYFWAAIDRCKILPIPWILCRVWILNFSYKNTRNLEKLLVHLLEILPEDCCVITNDETPSEMYGVPIPFRHIRNASRDLPITEGNKKLGKYLLVESSPSCWQTAGMTFCWVLARDI